VQLIGYGDSNIIIAVRSRFRRLCLTFPLGIIARMKHLTRWLSILIAISICGCSGFRPSVSKGRIVSAHEVAQFRGGGSMSTLWYRGSDERYHYFAHYVKVSTFYRVRRSELQMPSEFPYKSRDPVFIGDSPIWKSL
jgi:hypothetical protein